MDRNKLSLSTTKKILKLRNLLDKIGQVSWSFSILNKQHPIHTLNEKKAQELIHAYEDLINDVINSIKYEYENQKYPNKVLEG